MMSAMNSEFPQFTFDTSLLDPLDDLWFLRILTNDAKREFLLDKSSGDLTSAYDICIEEFVEGRKVEQISDCYVRTARLKEYLKKQTEDLQGN